MFKSFALSVKLIEFKIYVRTLILSFGLSLNSRFFGFTLSDRFDYFLAHEHPANRVTTIVHIGAHEGQERFLYERNQAKVFWIEANPYLLRKLRKNLRLFPNQVPIEGLLYSERDLMKEFHIANMGGQASSIYPLGRVQDIWPTIDYTDRLVLKTKTLDALIEEKAIVLSDRNMLVLDTQGSELEILRGGERNLHYFDYIVAEAADFELYSGSCTDIDLMEFLECQDFIVCKKTKFASLPNEKGGCYEIVFKNKLSDY